MTRTEETVPEYTLRDKLTEVLALALITVGLFVFISLVTYDEADIPGVSYPVNVPVQNSGGIVGARLAYLMLSNFGVAAYVAVFFACFWSFLAFFRRRVKGLTLKLIGAFVAVLALATLASMQSFVHPGQIGLAGTAPSTGGLYGEAFRLFLQDHIGSAGALLAVLLSLTISLLLGTNWMVATAGARFVEAARSKLGRLKTVIKGLSDPISGERRDKERQERRVAEWIQEEHRSRQPGVAEAGSRASARPEAAPTTPKTGKVALPRTVAAPRPRAGAEVLPYTQPPLELFDVPEPHKTRVSDKHIKTCAQIIERTLREFGIDAKVVGNIPGPSVTVYELELGPGVKTTKVLGLQNDFATKLAVPRVRIVAPLPGRTTVGVEIPNPLPGVVRVREFFPDPISYEGLRKIPLPLLLGKVAGGEPLIQSLTDMPHLLIAGSTGFGKTVCLKAMITSMISGMSPQELKLVMIDPKGTELTSFRDLPHLWAPVITETGKASMVLDWLVKEMDERYQLFERIQVNKISTYNRLGKKKMAQRLLQQEVDEQEWSKFPTRLPYIVVAIDELADLMMTSRREVEHSIIRLSQKSRAVGIHLVLATQRPSADVVTGLIRSNMPGRISFRVPTHVESKIVLDHVGAEGLVAKGEMLMILPGMLDPIRAQCTLVTDEEVGRVLDYLKMLGPPEYHMELLELNQTAQTEGSEDDEMFTQAVEVVLAGQRGSVSLVQRKLSIGYGRSARLIDSMERAGIVGPHNGANPREVLLTLEQWTELKRRDK